MTTNHRQSRLIQPSRLSLAPTTNYGQVSRIAAPASTFQSQQLRPSRAPLGQRQVEPSANTSGLPTPSRGRQRTVEQTARTPSTVASALRRRPAALEAPSLSSFGLRPAAPPQPPPRAPQLDQPDDLADDSSRSVESLPPLKSASYLSRLARSGDSSDSDHKTLSELAQNKQKPSQLVRPLAVANAVGSSLPKCGLLKAPVQPLSSSAGSKTCLPATKTNQLIKAAAKQANADFDSSSQSTATPLADEDDDEHSASEDDDDATTADSLTQTTSESANLTLASASQELNNMIKMLSSSAILADSELRSRDRLASSQAVGARSTELQAREPRPKSKVLKSQSLSFDQVSGRQILARPSSRIIFDPTSSQFHISTVARGRPSEEQQSLASGTSFESSSSSDASTSPTASADRSAQLLLDTQQQIIGLKSLAGLDSEAEVEAHSLPVNLASICAPPVAVRRRSPVGSALRSLFGTSRHSSTSGPAMQESKANPRKVATVVRHGSLRCPDSTEIKERKLSLSCSRAASPPVAGSRESSMNRYTGLGSDLLQRASRRLSASSSSLTNKFKFISSAPSSAQQQVSCCPARDGDTSAGLQRQPTDKGRSTQSAQASTSAQVSQFNCQQFERKQHHACDRFIVAKARESDICLTKTCFLSGPVSLGECKLPLPFVTLPSSIPESIHETLEQQS